MADLWYKRCPQCKNYMQKSDPQAVAVCRCCGWEEYTVSFFCTVAKKYCSVLEQEENGDDIVLTHPSLVVLRKP